MLVITQHAQQTPGDVTIKALSSPQGQARLPLPFLSTCAWPNGKREAHVPRLPLPLCHRLTLSKQGHLSETQWLPFP